MALTIALTSTEPRSSERERFAGRLLGRLGPHGFVVLADGEIAGPTGVVVVDTLTCTDALRVRDGELWHGRFPRRYDLAATLRKAADVRRIVARTDPAIPVRTLVCVLGVAVPDDPYCTLPVELCGPAELPDLVESGPRVLEFEAVLELARDLDPARRRWSALRPSHRRSR